MKVEYIAANLQNHPFIRLYSFDQPEILRLREIAGLLSQSSMHAMALYNEPSFHSVHACKLTLRVGTRDLGVFETGPATFECILTPPTWQWVTKLIDTLCDSPGCGFQWLSEEGEISLLLSQSGSW